MVFMHFTASKDVKKKIVCLCYRTTFILLRNETVYLIVVLKQHLITLLTDKQCSNQTRVKIHHHILMRIICISKTRKVSFLWTNIFCYIPHICVDLAWKYSIISFFCRRCSVIIQGP